jgi:hypothetical protein
MKSTSVFHYHPNEVITPYDRTSRGHTLVGWTKNTEGKIGVKVYKHKSGGFFGTTRSTATQEGDIHKTAAAAAKAYHDKQQEKLAEDFELDEAAFAPTMKKAIAAHERGDHKMAKYHLDNAKTARYAMKSTDIAKHKDLLDKYKELRDMHDDTRSLKQMFSDLKKEQTEIDAQHEFLGIVLEELGIDLNEAAEFDLSEAEMLQLEADVFAMLNKQRQDLFNKGAYKAADDTHKLMKKFYASRFQQHMKDRAKQTMAKEEASPMIKPPKNEFGTKADAFAHAKKHGGKVMMKTFTHPTTGMKHVSYVVREELELDEAIKLNSKVIMHAPGKDYHGQTGTVGEIRHGLHDKADKTYTIDYGKGKSVQLQKDNIKLHKEEAQGVAEGYTGRETKHGTWHVFKHGKAVAVAGPFKSREESAAWIKKQKQGVAEEQTYYSLVHKATKKVLSTHKDMDSAKDEHRGMDPGVRAHYYVATSKKEPKTFNMKEAGPFSYGAKPPRKGSVAYNALMKRKEQEKSKPPIEPKDQMVGTAKIIPSQTK